MAIKGKTEYRISEGFTTFLPQGSLRTARLEREQASKGSSLVIVRKLIK